MSLDGINPTSRPKVLGENFVPRSQRRPRRRRWPWVLALLVILGFFGYYFIVARTNKIFTSDTNIFKRVGQLIVGSDKPLIGEETGTINVLLMGIGGSGHDGAYLTDTMIVASINVKTHEAVMVSIPRDFAYTIPGIGFNKINATYAYARADGEREAGEAAIAAAEHVTGLEIPYYAVIDFRGFVEAINNIGGVDVVIENTFTDSSFPNDYPNDTRGYLAPITFTAGPAHMDGRTALIFARSRHSNNPKEGSDFARSERQKKIIAAVKEKVLNLGLGNLSTINNLLSDFTENFRTNFEPHEIKRLLDLAKEIDENEAYSFSLEPDGVLLCSAMVDARTGRVPPKPVTPAEPVEGEEPTEGEPVEEAPQILLSYVVMPCSGKTIEDVAKHVRLSPILAKLQSEGAIVEVQNSTGVSGLAARTFGNLTDLGVELNLTSFTGKVPYEQTLLYDNSHGGKPKTLDYIKSNYSPLTVSDVLFPASSADFVIIMGRDSIQTP